MKNQLFKKEIDRKGLKVDDLRQKIVKHHPLY